MKKNNLRHKIIVTLILVSLLILSSYVPAMGSYGGIDMISPLPSSVPVNAGYLYGELDLDYASYGHMGMDWAAPLNTEVYATYSGKVVVRDDQGSAGYGKYIIIESDHPLYSGVKFYHLYAHLNQFNVYLNDPVYPTQKIAWSGESGHTSGPHLHYEIRMGSNSWYNQRNPEGLLRRSAWDGYGAVHGKVLTSSGGWARQKRISGATKGTDINYGDSYSYYIMQNNNPFPDETAYGINYYIARANTGSVTLSYDYGARTQTVNITANTDLLANPVYLP